MPQPAPTINGAARAIFPVADSPLIGSTKSQTHNIAGATCVDFGIQTRGSLTGGRLLSRICMADQATISLVPVDPETMIVANGVQVQTDSPVIACLGSQYAGWPVKTSDFFAMGSGPMRMARGREDTLKHLSLTEETTFVVGVLECDQLPSESAIELVASDCGVSNQQVFLAVAPSTSIAGSYQVVSRSIETAMHKMHELKYDVTKIVSATGCAPLPPPAKPGDMAQGIGRTNDAILYGATVTMWVDDDDQAVAKWIDEIPSLSSADYGKPFAKVFEGYEYDFYQVDPMLFSPARIVVHCLKSGTTTTSGRLNPDVLRESFA